MKVYYFLSLIFSVLLFPGHLQGQKVYLEASGSDNKSTTEGNISQRLDYKIQLSLNWEAFNPVRLADNENLVRYSLRNLKGVVNDSIYASDTTEPITINNIWETSAEYDLQVTLGYMVYSEPKCRIVYLYSEINPLSESLPINQALEYIADPSADAPGKIQMKIGLTNRWSWLGNDYEIEGKPRFKRIGFIDEIPDYSLTDNKDSDNYFLRQHSGEWENSPADYKKLDIYYWFFPEEPEKVNSVKIHIYKEEEEEAFKTIEGQRAGGSYATGDQLHVVWENVKTDNGFPDAGFYRIQLEYTTDEFIEKTPIYDGDTELPGWQCPCEGLAIHDLVYKHRPQIFMGAGEKVCPNGPIHPFDPGYIGRYSLHEAISTGRGEVVNKIKDNFPLASGTLDDSYSILETFPSPISSRRIYFIDIKNEKREADDLPAYVFHRGHPDAHENYIFVHYWMYEPASHGSQGSFMENAFIHEGDWEMVQLCIKKALPQKPELKTHWFLPFAATASQHYYGQTLAWRLEEPGTNSTFQNQLFVQHVSTDEPNRFKVFVAENGHASYFRSGKIRSHLGKCGTQIQYEPIRKREDGSEKDHYDQISPPFIIPDYRLITLENRNEKGIYDWKGLWGEKTSTPYKEVIIGHAPPSPKYRHVNHGFLGLDKIMMDADPVGFHNACRRRFSGLISTLTELE